jgi:hypothetical protein
MAIRCQTRASASEIADAMRGHAACFSEPLDDEKWIQRTAKSIERIFENSAQANMFWLKLSLVLQAGAPPGPLLDLGF